jgi:thymidylate synthase (FAD)
MKNEHMTPFEKIVFEFHVRAPLYIGEQWLRHRIGSFNKESGRYKQLSTDFHVPKEFRGQDEKNKQASSETLPASTHAKYEIRMINHYNASKELYKDMLGEGIVREQARGVLPTNLFTEFYWTVNFRSLMNFLSLRDDSHAQWEIRQYAIAIKEILKGRKELKWCIEAFEKTDKIKKLIKKLMNSHSLDAVIDKLKDLVEQH